MPAKSHKPEPSIVLRMVRQEDGKLIAAAHLKRRRAKIDRFSLIAMREVPGPAEAEAWAHAIARAGRVQEVEIEEIEELNQELPVKTFRVASQTTGAAGVRTTSG